MLFRSETPSRYVTAWAVVVAGEKGRNLAARAMVSAADDDVCLGEAMDDRVTWRAARRVALCPVGPTRWARCAQAVGRW